MKPSDLDEGITQKVQFELARRKDVPNSSGTYLLTTYEDHVLYIGKATSLRTRMTQHLEDDLKLSRTEFGRAFWFYYLTCKDILEATRIEHAWFNQSILLQGSLPPLNRKHD